MFKRFLPFAAFSILALLANLGISAEPYAITDGKRAALVIKGKQLNFEIPEVAYMFGGEVNPTPVTHNEFNHGRKVIGTIRRGTPVIDVVGSIPGAFLDDRGNKWPVNALLPVKVNGSRLKSVSKAQYDQHRTVGHLRFNAGDFKAKLLERSNRDGPVWTMSNEIFVNGTYLRFDNRDLARVFSRNSVLNATSSRKIRNISRGAKCIMLSKSGQPGCFIDDTGFRWAVLAYAPVAANGSPVLKERNGVTPEKYHSIPMAGILRMYREPRQPKPNSTRPNNSNTSSSTNSNSQPPRPPAGPFGYWFRLNLVTNPVVPVNNMGWTRWFGPYRTYNDMQSNRNILMNQTRRYFTNGGNKQETSRPLYKSDLPR